MYLPSICSVAGWFPGYTSSDDLQWRGGGRESRAALPSPALPHVIRLHPARPGVSATPAQAGAPGAEVQRGAEPPSQPSPTQGRFGGEHDLSLEYLQLQVIPSASPSVLTLPRTPGTLWEFVPGPLHSVQR